jgi:flagellar basal body-associated protein FliL
LLELQVGYANFLEEVFDDSFISETLDDSALASAQEALNDAGAGVVDEDALQEIGEVFPLKNIILNIRHKNGAHDSLLKISLGLELENEDLLDELQNKKTQLKHLIIINLSHSYYSDMRDFKFRKMLKAKIRNQINGFLKTGSIKRIFITQQIFD